MAAGKRTTFTTVRTEGGLLPADLLQRITDGDRELGGLSPHDYHLIEGERLNEAINRSWSRLVGVWAGFQAAASKLNPDDAATGLTRERWLLILFQELGYGRLQPAKGLEAGGRTFAISHKWLNTPIHLIGCGVDLDKRTAGIAGAARSSPHSLLQEFLNRDEKALWGFVSNGLMLRLLRDNARLTRQAFVEFDLDAMMRGEVYSDFVLLWLICHQSRVETDVPAECWLERWSQAAQKQGARALDKLRNGVEEAIKALGCGFLSHPSNETLRARLRSGALSTQDFYRQILRLVYRLLFLFAAEDRNLLLLPTATDEAVNRFNRFYSTARLRTLAQNRRGTRHSDLFQGVRLVMQKLGDDSGCLELALPALGSFLFSHAAVADIGTCEISNRDFLDAIRSLALTTEAGGYRSVDYKNLGAEELGSVYESLLELHPEIQIEAGTLDLGTVEGNERKTSGSYYTPDSLVQCLLDSALEPVVQEAIEGKSGTDAERALLSLKVCDPAVGSGHFLVGAAHRLAKHLARIRAVAQGESEPPPLLYQSALRDVIGRCLYGVDINPMSAELCRVSLWLEALEPGKPLSFLDHHIRVGNSLLGTTPELIAAGLPDEAFTAIEGDDKKACAVLKKRNRAERQGWGPIFAQQDAEIQARLQQAAAVLEELPDDRPEDIRAKELAFGRHEQTDEYRYKKQLADSWCAAFVMRKYFSEPGRDSSATGITQGHVNDLAGGQLLPAELGVETKHLSDQYQFFHWHLAFPEVFAKDGFDCVLGNPPWERIQVEAFQFFSALRPDLLELKRSDREVAIERLATEDPILFTHWQRQRRLDLTTTAFLKSAGIYPYSTQKNVNSYAVFQELALRLTNLSGRSGLVVQSGIATDDILKPLFQFLVSSRRLVSLFDFENREKLFPGVDSRLKFCLLSTTGSRGTSERADFVFYAITSDDLEDAGKHFTLSAEDMAILNPNTRTCPIFRSQDAGNLCMLIYRRISILIREVEPARNPWGAEIRRMFDMSYDSHLFRTWEQLTAVGFDIGNASCFVKNSETFLRLYEAKLVHQFDHRFASFQLGSPNRECDEVPIARKVEGDFAPTPRYWVSLKDYGSKMEGTGWKYPWIVAFREITNSTNERTSIAAILPISGVGNTCYTLTFSTDAPAADS